MFPTQIMDNSKQLLEQFNILDSFRKSINNNSLIFKARAIYNNRPTSKLMFRIVWNAFLYFLIKRNKAYIHRNKLVSNILEATKIFIARYQPVIRSYLKSKQNHNEKQKEQVFRTIFGGKQFHNLTSYRDNIEQLDFQFDNVRSIHHSQPSNVNRPITLSQINNTTSFSLQHRENETVLAFCSPNCVIIEYWALNFYKFFQKLNNAKSYLVLQKF